MILDDAWALVKARKGRLAFGLFLMLINRLSGLVLPGTTKFLLDEVIGKHNRAMLKYLVLAAGGATLLQAITSFALSQILGKAAQRSITDMRRTVQRHVGRLPVALFRPHQVGRAPVARDERRRGVAQPGGQRAWSTSSAAW